MGAVAAADRLIGPYYRTQLFAARDRAKDELCDLDEEQLEAIAAEGRKAAGRQDEDGAPLTVRLTEHRERHSRLAADLQREAELVRPPAMGAGAAAPAAGPDRCGGAS